MPKASLKQTGTQAWNSQWFRSLGSASLSAWFVSLSLGLALAICEADLFVPFFWERRLIVEVGLLLAVAIVQTVLALHSVDSFIHQLITSERPVERFSLILVAGGLLITAFWIAADVAGLLANSAASGSVNIAASAGKLSLNRSVELVFFFVLASLLGITHVGRMNSRFTAEQKLYYPLVFLAVCFAGIYLINNVLSLIDTNLWQFRFPSILPVFNPVGMDFRRGIYLPAHRLLSGFRLYAEDPSKSLNFYPPLVAVLGLPYVLLDENAAYILHVFLLFIANAFCLVLAARLARVYFADNSKPAELRATTVHLALLLLVGFGLFAGYPFLFSIERGNIDIFAMVLALASIEVLLRHPRRIWVQVILLSIAVHIKAYPLFLFAALFFVNGIRIILPAALVNAALLLVIGPVNAIGFIGSLLRYYNPVIWVGNHSGYAFAALLAGDLPALAPALPALQVFFTCVPLTVWILAWLALARFPGKDQAVLSGFMITVPLMAVFPSLSNDYQLVILSSAVLMLLALILTRMSTKQNASDYLQLLLVSVTTLFIGRSYVLMPASPAILQDKYLWIVLLQLVMLVNILQQLQDARTETSDGVDPLQALSPASDSPGGNNATQSAQNGS